VKADDKTAAEITALIHETFRRLSTPGSNPGELLVHPDIVVMGSNKDDLMYGPEVVGQVSALIAASAFSWKANQILVWREGDVAWAQAIGTVTIRHDEVSKVVPYWTTGVFARGDGGWQWRYFAGSRPHDESWG
jgi:hypothetical protein